MSKVSRSLRRIFALGGVLLINSCTLENKASFEAIAREQEPKEFKTSAAGIAWNFIPLSAKACCYQNGNGPDKVIDDDTGTYWHSAWSTTSGSDYGLSVSSGWPNNHSGTPHFITLDLGEVKRNIESFVHIGRNANGGIRQYEIWAGSETAPGIDPASQVGTDIQKVAEGTWNPNGAYEEVLFEPPINARYFQVRVITAIGNYGGGVEFKICATGDFTGSTDTAALRDAYIKGVAQLNVLKPANIFYHKLSALLYGEWDDNGLVKDGAQQILAAGDFSIDSGHTFDEVLARQQLLDKFTLDIRTLLRAISPALYTE